MLGILISHSFNKQRDRRRFLGSCLLYCTVLYCTVLYCTVLYCTVLLYYTLLYCTVLYCTVTYCTVLYLHISDAEKQERTDHNLTFFYGETTTISSTSLIREIFQGYRCESCMPLLSWRVTCNYDDATFSFFTLSRTFKNLRYLANFKMVFSIILLLI